LLGRAPAATSPRRLPWHRLLRSFSTAAVIVAVAYAALWTVQSDAFRVGHIAIEGIEVTSPEAIVAAADLGGDLMLTLDRSTASERIAELASVKSVSVSRSWPSTVRIEIVEHQAWGYWQSGAERISVDREGQPLLAARPAPPDAPTIIEFAAPRDRGDALDPDPDAVRLAARLIEDRRFAERGTAPIAFLFEQGRGLTVHFEDAPSVVFGDSANYEYKLASWVQAHEQIAVQALTVVEMDLRFVGQVVLR
jgi:hypothetical protein